MEDAEAFIRQTLREGIVYYYRSDTLTGSAEPHFYVVLSCNDEELILLVCATSNIERRKRIREANDWPSETLVIVSPKEAPFLDQESAFDCNFVQNESIRSLARIHSRKPIVIKGQASVELLRRLKVGVLKSSQIVKKVQDILRKL